MLEANTWSIYVKRGYLDLVKNLFSNIALIDKVVHKEELFWGPYIAEAPDLILIPRKHNLTYVFFDTRIYGEPIYKSYMGVHDPRALLAIYGEGISPLKISGDIKISIYDIKWRNSFAINRK